MEKKVLLKDLVDTGTNVRKQIRSKVRVSDKGAYPIGELWDANTTVDEIVEGASIAIDIVREVEQRVAQLDSSLSTESSRATSAENALQQAITDVQSLFVDYYTKSQTYTKDEILQMVDDIKQFSYESVTDLPIASANTMHKIYLVPSSEPGDKNIKTEYITVQNENQGTYTYKWEQLGSTDIKLDNYYTKSQADSAILAALTAALANYTTTAALTTILEDKQNKINDLDTIRSGAAKGATSLQPDDITDLLTDMAFINKSFGKYDGETEVVLTQAKAGKYVNVNGGETTQAGYGISTPISLNAGDILLVPSAQAVPVSVSVIARLVDRTYQKVIAYIYTYRTDYPELPATATADYDSSLVYTAVYDETGETPTLTGWTRDGQTYTTLPATREVNEQFYLPLMKQAVAAMPSTGYYVYLCPTAMTVVISGLTATVDGGKALVVGWGIFKNITTNFVGAPGQSVLAQAFAVLFTAIDGLRAQLSDLGETRADSIDFGYMPKLCGQPMVIEAEGAPASPNFPTMVGQRYHDTIGKKVYEAFSVTGAVSDWVLLN